MSTDKSRPTSDKDDVKSDGPDGGPSMSGPGAVTGTVSKPMPGEKNHAERAKAAKVLSRD